TWSGCALQPSGSCTLTLGADATVGLTFKQQYTLSVTKPANGTVMGNGILCGTGGNACSAVLDTGTAVSLAASPDATYVVDTWSGGGRRPRGACRTSLGSNAAAAATVKKIQHTLTITKPSNGTITGNTGNITCGTLGNACSATLDTGTAVSLTASADTMYTI